MSGNIKIWVTGASGMLGQDVVKALKLSGFAVIATDREVDITDPAAVANVWEQNPEVRWIVNCAAWTAVDAAEENAHRATILNVDGPAVLSRSAHEHNARILQISTDYVFSGDGDAPYTPYDETGPRSVYGQTKLAGETAVQAACAHHIILRTAWLYGEAGKNFVYTMIRLMNDRSEISVVSDQVGLPTWTVDLAAAIVRILETVDSVDTPWGICHYTNARETESEQPGNSWFDFAMAIYRKGRSCGLIKTECAIKPIRTHEYPTPAPRPAFSVLDSMRTIEVFGVNQPDWQMALGSFLSTIEHRKDI